MSVILSISNRELKRILNQRIKTRRVILSISNRELKLVLNSNTQKICVILSISNRELKPQDIVGLGRF